MRVPFFKDRPTLRSPRRPSLRRVLVILSPTDADVPSVRALWRRLRPLGVAVVATTECHGEVRGERGQCLIPHLLLVDAARETWDALVVAGGSGAALVAEDQFAREVAGAIAAQHKPVAALGRGRAVLARAGLRGFASDDPEVLADWLGEALGLRQSAPRGSASTAESLRPA